MTVAKAEASCDLYVDLETPEEEKRIYRIARNRNKSTKDVNHVRQMKDANGLVQTDEMKVQERWKEFFKGLFNEENSRDHQDDGIPRSHELCRAEVVRALKRMKSNKNTRPDEIPVEAWRVLGEVGVDLLWNLMYKIEEQEEIPDEWGESVLIPIFKEKGDVQECANYRRIKFTITHFEGMGKDIG